MPDVTNWKQAAAGYSITQFYTQLFGAPGDFSAVASHV